MAKQSTDSAQEYKLLRNQILQGDIRPVYLLFGTEHYYIDELCSLLMDTVVPQEEKDFGQIVFYGSETGTNTIISAARQFPMMVSRQLVVVKEAQMLSRERGKIEDFEVYFNAPMPSTVLVICYKTVNDPTKSGKNIDKRTSFYKKAQQVGAVFESAQVPDYKMQQLIESFVADKGLSINPVAAKLLADYSGVDLQKIDVEINKLMKLLPEGTREISVSDIENNVGISREYSTFELTKALSEKNSEAAFRIAAFFARSPKRYPFVKTSAVLASHFMKILRMEALLSSGVPRNEMLSMVGVSPYFSREYDAAMRNYPQMAAMKAISLLKEYDFRSKSSLRGEAEDGDLLIELVSRLISGC